MKLIDNADFLEVSSKINEQKGVCRVQCRLESYSCKAAGQDKKLFKQLKDGDELEALAPAHIASTSTALNCLPRSFLVHREDSLNSLNSLDETDGILCPSISKKTLYYLKATLNASFSPDYDFSQTKSSEFTREPSFDYVARAINGQMISILADEHSTLSHQLWQSLAKEIKPDECDIYSYNPDLESDPFGEEGILWSFNYFFYNKKMKRMVFFTCRARRRRDDVFFVDDDDDDLVSPRFSPTRAEDTFFNYDEYAFLPLSIVFVKSF